LENGKNEKTVKTTLWKQQCELIAEVKTEMDGHKSSSNFF